MGLRFCAMTIGVLGSQKVSFLWQTLQSELPPVPLQVQYASSSTPVSPLAVPWLQLQLFLAFPPLSQIPLPATLLVGLFSESWDPGKPVATEDPGNDSRYLPLLHQLLSI